MGDGDKTPLRLQFNPKVRLEFHGATITSDAGLLPIRELDDALGLTPIASDYLQESRTGRNIRHHLVPLLRQSIYSRLAGYDDTNDAERLSQDPAMRVVVGWQGSDRNAARTNTMSRFETETLTQEDNLKGLALMNPQWVRPTDNWNFSNLRWPRIDGFDSYGYIPGDVYANCLWYYARDYDSVLDPMAGSGMVLHVWQERNTWLDDRLPNLTVSGSDLNPPVAHTTSKSAGMTC